MREIRINSSRKNILKYLALILLISLLAIGCKKDTISIQTQRGDNMRIESPAFEEGEMIPKRYTCQGEDINPELRFSEVPDGTKSLALIVEDPDAPMGIWIHWVLKNIDANVRKIEENSVVGEQVRNSFGKEDYGGPCPPSGTHRYYFRLYALNKENMEAENVDELKEEIERHKIEEAILMGRYSKG